MSTLVLGGDFPPASSAQWEKAVAKVVARAAKVDSVDDPIGTLTARTADGLSIAPLYIPGDGAAIGLPGAAPFTRSATAAGITAGWDVRTSYVEDDPKALHEYVLEDLEGGATSLWLRVGAGGVPVADLPTVLGGVLLDLAGICLDAAPDSAAVAGAFLDHAAARGVPTAELSGCLGVDPIGWAARTGDYSGVDAGGAAAADLAKRVAGSKLRTVVVDALPYHDAGATDAQELALSLAAGVAALRSLARAGLDVATALGQLEFRFAATADQFGTICKLRAARRTWARVAQAASALSPAAGQRQHAVTSWPMTTVADSYNNMLRTTLAAFAACVGGADSITVRPFDAALGRPDALARRIARNTPALIVEESHVAKVIDPAGGAWYVESFTESLAAAAWERFQKIEAAGGIVAALRAGVVAEHLAASREKKVAELVAGSESIVGVTVFPPNAEKVPVRSPAPALPCGGLPRIRWEELFARAKEGAA